MPSNWIYRAISVKRMQIFLYFNYNSLSNINFVSDMEMKTLTSYYRLFTSIVSITCRIEFLSMRGNVFYFSSHK